MNGKIYMIPEVISHHIIKLETAISDGHRDNYNNDWDHDGGFSSGSYDKNHDFDHDLKGRN
ncbi:hypothetical protein [Domibacillus mangrovi]|uniref:Uncharacterized protein n=1 Tax=Domibacillus mangrovi TaxID=1714354 RepID=A0A1Q5P2U2_9BACI|nr:hypothetical protein [Domibacillus mangrovi]OKL36546.1 hypothetical protein BLL40_07330 [Domibacillus mangrovi]